VTIEKERLQRIHLVVPGPDLVRRLVEKLQEVGVPSEGMAVFSYYPDRLANLPAAVTGLTARPSRIFLWGLVFCAVGLLAGLALLAKGTHWLVVPGLAFAGLNLGAGGAYKLSLSEDAEPVRGELGRDDVLMLVDVGDELREQIHQAIQHYPEVRSVNVMIP